MDQAAQYTGYNRAEHSKQRPDDGAHPVQQGAASTAAAAEAEAAAQLVHAAAAAAAQAVAAPSAAEDAGGKASAYGVFRRMIEDK
jgi:hypothetical protein